MVLLYVWQGIIGLLLLMLAVKPVLWLALCFRGAAVDWSRYNNVMIMLAIFAFMPIAVLFKMSRKK